jgi:hypothetical protein
VEALPPEERADDRDGVEQWLELTSDVAGGVTEGGVALLVRQLLHGFQEAVDALDF